MNNITKPKVWAIYVKNAGGTFVATENFCSLLAKNRRVTLVRHILPEGYEAPAGSFRLLRTLLLSLRCYFHLLFWASRNRQRLPDFIYTPSVLVAFVILYVPLLSKTRLIRHFHNFDFGEDDKSLTTYIRAVARGSLWRLCYFAPLLTLIYLIEKASLVRAWRIIVPLQYSRQLIRRRFPSVNRRQITVIPNGFENKIFYPAPRAVNPKKYQIIYVGRFVPEKGIKQLLEAFSLLDPDHYQLTIISPGFTDPILLKALNQMLQRKGKIVTLTNPSPSLIGEMYRKSNLSILPSSVIFEQMPLAYLESLACGVPVLISKNIKGVISYQKNISPSLILPNTSPAMIAARIQQYCSLSSNQRNIVKRRCLAASSLFSWSASARLLAPLFLENLKAKGHRGH